MIRITTAALVIIAVMATGCKKKTRYGQQLTVRYNKTADSFTATAFICEVHEQSTPPVAADIELNGIKGVYQELYHGDHTWNGKGQPDAEFVFTHPNGHKFINKLSRSATDGYSFSIPDTISKSAGGSFQYNISNAQLNDITVSINSDERTFYNGPASNTNGTVTIDSAKISLHTVGLHKFTFITSWFTPSVSQPDADRANFMSVEVLEDRYVYIAN